MNEQHPFRLTVSLLAAAALALVLSACKGTPSNVQEFQTKADLLKQEALADWVRESLGDSPPDKRDTRYFSRYAAVRNAPTYTAVRAKRWMPLGKAPRNAPCLS